MEIVRLGIIGTGRMGITHSSIINSREDVKIVAIADTNRVILSFMEKYIKGVSVFKNYEDMLNPDVLDAILVCTPPGSHYPIIKMAGDRGIHVFVEKPFTARYDQGKMLADDFSRNGLVNQVGYVNRFNDVFVKAKELLEEGVIGDVIRFKSEMFSCTISKPDKGYGWRATRESGGGVVYEMASHAIDLVNYLIGKPQRVTGSALNYIFSKNVDDAVSSTFLYDNGIVGTLFVNWCDASYRKPTNKIEILGMKGKILADQHSLKIFLNKENEKSGLRKGWNTLFITDIFRPVSFYVRGNEFSRQLYDFIDGVQGNKDKCLCTFKDGVDTLEVIKDILVDVEKSGRN